MNMLVWATQVAGLSRAKIRDVLVYRTKPFPGVTGDIPFGAALDDIGEVFLARFEGGAGNTTREKTCTFPNRTHRGEPPKVAG